MRDMKNVSQTFLFTPMKFCGNINSAASKDLLVNFGFAFGIKFAKAKVCVGQAEIVPVRCRTIFVLAD